MNKEIKEKWVKALRSGDYTQGRSKLRRSGGATTKYCCLGVLAEVVKGPEVWSTTEFGGGFLPSACAEECGIDYRSKIILDNLMAMNDSIDDQSSFDEIADYIEKNL